jgi:hypothetical protein
MKRLKDVINATLPDATSLGGGRNVDRNRLIDVLGDLGSDLSRAYWVRAFVVVCVLGLLIAIVWRLADQPNLLAAAVAATAMALMGAFVALRQVTDEIARVRLVQAIAPELSLEALTELARRIVMTA